MSRQRTTIPLLLLLWTYNSLHASEWLVLIYVLSKDWDTTIMDAAPGQLLGGTKRAGSYLIESPLDFEGKSTSIPAILCGQQLS